MNAAAVQRLESYLQRMGEVLGNESRRGSFAMYAMGLLGEAERKSFEPIALLHFAVDSKWSDQEVRREAAQYGLEATVEREPVEAWIVDDTGFLKQGQHSVGVQRQYAGSAGKITNSWANSPERRQEARIPPEVTFLISSKRMARGPGTLQQAIPTLACHAAPSLSGAARQAAYGLTLPPGSSIVCHQD